ncbi:MAG: hypothetical protein EOO16_09320 [Chitinophagaceae bacterium]|nr:MAG: hypothetical protein EOO16_09320 [Chitinophagaceae bacterium]
MRTMKITAAFLMLGLALASCSKKNTVKESPIAATTNIDFGGLSVKTVQDHINGRWQLRRVTGGIAGDQMVHPVRHNPYIIFNGDHLTLGNDSLGVFVDEAITWAPATMFGGGYVLSTANQNVMLVPTGIRNDTLVLKQYAADGVTYQYTR